MTGKELLVGVVVPIGAAVVGAVAVWALTPDWEASARSKGWAPAAEWQAEARRQHWIPESECPGFPVSLRVESPGDGATLRVSDHTIHSRFLVELSRPIRDNYTIYLAIQKKDDTNIYLIDHLDHDSTSLVSLPFNIKQPVDVKLWALVVSDPASEYRDYRTGEIYTDTSQLKGLRGLLCMSEPIHLSLVPDN